MKSPRTIAIVGGGVFGCCAAYELAKAGVAVTLIERDPIGSHASGKNPGNLNPLLATPPQLVPFALASFLMHRTLKEELAKLECEDYHVENVRRILVAFDAKDMEQLAPIQRLFSSHDGFSAEWMNADAVRQSDARLSRDITAGLLLQGNLSMDSLAFNRAIAQGAVAKGAQLIRANVTGIRLDGGNAVAVRTDVGDITCDALLLANGPWAMDADRWLNVQLPVEPVKGEMLRMRLPGQNITHDFTHGLISLYRRGNNEVWIGVTRERCGLDEAPTLEGRRLLLDGARRIFPAIVEAEELEHLASLRPSTPSGLPLITRVPIAGNVMVANGGGAKGMLLCAGVGRAICDFLLTGETMLPVRDFDV